LYQSKGKCFYIETVSTRTAGPSSGLTFGWLEVKTGPKMQVRGATTRLFAGEGALLQVGSGPLFSTRFGNRAVQGTVRKKKKKKKKTVHLGQIYCFGKWGPSKKRLRPAAGRPRKSPSKQGGFDKKIWLLFEKKKKNPLGREKSPRNTRHRGSPNSFNILSNPQRVIVIREGVDGF